MGCMPLKSSVSTQIKYRSSQNQQKPPNPQSQQSLPINQQVLTCEEILKNSLQQTKTDLIKKRISLGRRSIQIAQNAQIIQEKYLNRIPSQPVDYLQSVILSREADARKKIQQNNKYPFSSIGYIAVDFVKPGQQTISSFGTGSLIHKKHVLTCAHNVYNRQLKVKASLVYFIPAMCGQKGKRYKAKNIYYPKIYQTAEKNQKNFNDFAVIQLDADDLSQEYGYLGVNTIINGQQLAMIYGYPDDLNQQKIKKWLWGTQGIVRQSLIYQQQLNYTIATFRGQSGAPIIRHIGKSTYEVIGIHLRYIQKSAQQQGFQLQNNINSGLKFTQEVKNTINNWVKLQGKELNIKKRTFNISQFKQIMNSKWNLWSQLTKISLSSNNINAEMLQIFTNKKARYPKLLILDLCDNNIETQSIKALTSNNKAFPNLQELVLDNNKIQTQGIKILIQNHIAFPVLSGLFLNSNKLNGKSIKQLTQKKISPFPFLDNLDLGNNQIKEDQCDSLSKITQIFPNLTQFGISKSIFGDQGIKKLFQLQNSFNNASQLGLGNTRITEKGIKSMMKNGKSYFPNLTRLWLQNNYLEKDGCKELVSNKNTFPNLVQLQIYSNEIRAEGFQYLIKKSDSFLKLQKLEVSINQIQDIGLSFLKHNQKSMPKLKQIYLDSNKITDDGIFNLTQNKQVFKNLKKLSLKKNEIKSDGIKYLMNSQAFPNLQILYLQQNAIGDKGFEHFSRNLSQRFKNILVISLRSNGLTSFSIKLLVQQYKQFQTVTTLGLMKNQIDKTGLEILLNNKIDEKFPKLQKISLKGNQLIQVDFEKIQKLYKNIKVK